MITPSITRHPRLDKNPSFLARNRKAPLDMRIVRGGFHRRSIACTAGAVGLGADGRARRGYVAEIVGRRWVADVAGVIAAKAGVQR